MTSTTSSDSLPKRPAHRHMIVDMPTNTESLLVPGFPYRQTGVWISMEERVGLVNGTFSNTERHRCESSEILNQLLVARVDQQPVLAR
jgi:hypothetical protein